MNLLRFNLQFKIKLYVVIFLVLCNFPTFSQEKYSITGRVKIENGQINNTFITIYENANKLESKLVDNNGKFSYELDFGNDYVFEFSKEGFVTKKVNVSTFVPEDILSSDSQFPPFKFMVSLFPTYKGVDLSIFDQPVGIITYDKELDDFDYDRDYDSQIRDAIRKAEEEARRKAEELEAQRLAREKAYKAAIKKGDIAFRGKKYEESKLAYNDALVIKAEEQYPKSQIEKIDELLEDRQRQADEAEKLAVEKKALKEKYASIITLADSQFESGDYLSSKTSYTDALALRFDEQYPKSQIERINGLLEKQQRKADEAGKLAAEKKALDEKYASLVTLADSQFESGDYTSAKTSYTDALALKSGEQYPKSQIRKIGELLAEQQRQADDVAKLAAERKALDEKYASIIALADSQLKSNDYTSAKTSYTDALALKSDEQYPKSQISKIGELLAEQQRQADDAGKLAAEKKALDEKYASIIALADSQLESDDYTSAKTSYADALAIKAEERYPKLQIAEIDELLAKQQRQANEAEKLAAEKKALDKKYASIITLADSQFESGDYSFAKSSYSEASKLKPIEDYPKNQLKKILDIIAEQKRQADEEAKLLAQQQLNKSKYLYLIKSADKHFELGQWNSAAKNYRGALKLKPEEQYPQSKIKEIEAVLAELERKENERSGLRREYEGLIEIADKQFGNEEYDFAISKYQEALGLMPKESYPKNQLKRIEVILERKAIAERRENDLNLKYNEELEKAEGFLKKEQFSVAKHHYKAALEIKPKEKYPENQLKEIDKLIREMKNSVLSEEYKQLIAKGDKELSANHYTVAKFYYNKALGLNVEDKYPKNQLKKIEESIKLRKNQKSDKEYNEIILKADAAFDKGNLTVAKFYYAKALLVKSGEDYPKEKLKIIQSKQSKK